jgi:hypothetical protein
LPQVPNIGDAFLPVVHWSFGRDVGPTGQDMLNPCRIMPLSIYIAGITTTVVEAF